VGGCEINEKSIKKERGTGKKAARKIKKEGERHAFMEGLHHVVVVSLETLEN